MGFEITKSTSTELEVKFSETLKLVGKRHSNRFTGASVWETFFYKYGKIKKRDPFGGLYATECWFIPKGNTLKGVRLAKTWNKKADIMESLDQLKKIYDEQVQSDN